MSDKEQKNLSFKIYYPDGNGNFVPSEYKPTEAEIEEYAENIRTEKWIGLHTFHFIKAFLPGSETLSRDNQNLIKGMLIGAGITIHKVIEAEKKSLRFRWFFLGAAFALAVVKFLV